MTMMKIWVKAGRCAVAAAPAVLPVAGAAVDCGAWDVQLASRLTRAMASKQMRRCRDGIALLSCASQPQAASMRRSSRRIGHTVVSVQPSNYEVIKIAAYGRAEHRREILRDSTGGPVTIPTLVGHRTEGTLPNRKAVGSVCKLG